ncbi:hypothetical protein PROFUN_04453 [Planoprotostelium fungivorum]|uniref:Protein kinase domain-containing protein n=1 Tax=Planoprotostelium fungivorum TaxID=1890364 RepID=A0A2P6NVN4_9EUKA|nr:hypothetical protein PROFUN_04453 [Planoprotostelium fungivorum]
MSTLHVNSTFHKFHGESTLVSIDNQRSFVGCLPLRARKVDAGVRQRRDRRQENPSPLSLSTTSGHMRGDYRLILLVLVCGWISTVRADGQSDLAALRDLYDKTQGGQWTQRGNWNNATATNACQFYGVTCDRNLSVIALSLDANNLSGMLPPSIGNLTNLKSLTLSSNYLVGALPSSLTLLLNLNVFNISDNSFSGPFLNLSSLKQLVLLDASFNFFNGDGGHVQVIHLITTDDNSNTFSGNIPNSIGGASSLVSLSLYANTLNGSIPTSMGKLSNLKLLSLYNNFLSGEIPTSLGQLTNLQSLDLSVNQLGGHIPSTLGNLVLLTALRLHGNNLNGSIPEELYGLKNLQLISLRGNSLSGAISSNIGGLISATILDISFNHLVGELPVTLGKPSKLTAIHLSNNNLTGTLPDTLCNLTGLTQLSLGYNSLSGALPPCLGTMFNLTLVSLEHNQFNRGIGNFSTLYNLQTLDVSYNTFQEVFPSAISYLDISNNNFSGNIPDDFKQFAPLTHLDFSSNSFTGHLTADIQFLPRLTSANYSHNSLSGYLPGTLSFLTKLNVIDVSYNRFRGVVDRNFEEITYAGPIPSFSGLSSLTRARADFNMLTEIPQSFLTLTNLIEFSCSNNQLKMTNLSLFLLPSLQHLNLSNNEINGPFPDDLSAWSQLVDLDLSNNEIYGEVPKSFYQVRSATTVRLNSNQLSGPMPNLSCDPKTLDLSGNSFSGGLEFLNSLSSITNLNISHNAFSGQIPSLLSQSKLETVDMSHNNLNGTSKIQYNSLPVVTWIDFSHNLLNGTVPYLGSDRHSLLVHLDLSNNLLTDASSMGIISSAVTLCNMDNNSFVCPVPVDTVTTCGIKCSVLNYNSIQMRLFVEGKNSNSQKIVDFIASHYQVNPNRITVLFSDDSRCDLQISAAPKDTNEASADWTFQRMKSNLPISFESFTIYNVISPVPKEAPLSKGAIAGIAVGSFIFLLLLVLIVLFFLRYTRKKKLAELQLDAMDNLILTNLIVQETIGVGNFGEVYKGTWAGTVVALKGVKSSAGVDDENFKSEIRLLQKLNHPNVVRLLGVYHLNEKLHMVLEYAANGGLDRFLWETTNSDNLTNNDLLSMCLDAARGMTYLQSKGIIHRDLACRNLLLDESLRVKISDFGLSAEVGMDRQDHIPFRWSAPEVIKDRTCTHQSDVWSFGVVMWEILSLGAIPYQALSNKQVVDYVTGGNMMYQPDRCSHDVYNLMKKCWAMDPNVRPNFMDIQAVISRRLKATNHHAIRVKTPRPNTDNESDSMFMHIRQQQSADDLYNTDRQSAMMRKSVYGLEE